jgi:hypothetical protein
MKKEYWINGTQLASAREAMAAHRKGKDVVAWYHNSHTVTIKGAAQAKKTRLDENTAHCKHIADKLDEYVNGSVRRCPKCGEEVRREDWNYECFKCPECGAVSDPDDWEQLNVWDFLSDVYNVEFRTSGRGVDDLRSVQIMVACGGPNIYLDTASKDVELYWWSERAHWPMSYDAVTALDEWAAEYWGCM